jgi:hypothetical protein
MVRLQEAASLLMDGTGADEHVLTVVIVASHSEKQTAGGRRDRHDLVHDAPDPKLVARLVFGDVVEFERFELIELDGGAARRAQARSVRISVW